MLSDGFTLAEIGRHFSKSEDWVSTRVRELRQALVDQLVERQDEMPPELRSLVEALSTAPGAAGATIGSARRTATANGGSRIAA